MLVPVLILALAGGPLVAPAAAEPVTDRATWSPEEWIAAVDRRAEAVGPLRYSVHRKTERGGTVQEERWRFVTAGSRFRIDYFGDTTRQITCDGDVLVDYVPIKRAAQRFTLSKLPDDERATVLTNVLQHVAVPGLRVGEAEGVTWQFVDAPQGVIAVQGTGRDKTALRYELDADRLTVLRTEITRADQLVVRTTSSDHREIAPGVWFPHHVEVLAPDKGGEVRVTLDLTKVAVLADPPAELFSAELAPSTTVQERPR